MNGSLASIKLLVLATHNIMRWVTIGLAIYALVRLINGWTKNNQWASKDQRALTFFTIALDLQIMLGLLLYFVFSDLTRAAFADLASAMGNQVLRFFTIEHALIMIIAVVAVHLANAAGKKDLPGKQKWRRITLLIIFSIILILAGIPWTSRPLFPGI